MPKSSKQLIEECFPIDQISKEARREKSLRHGHISTLHQWWSRKPLVAARAAVFATLLPAPTNASERKAKLKQLEDLGSWDLSEQVLEQARADLKKEYPLAPPKILDPFAGGGSLPLEALRLGCDVYANDLNPVASLIQHATLSFPQKWGPQLADEVEYWGQWVYQKAQEEIGDLYPWHPAKNAISSARKQPVPFHEDDTLEPSSFLWSRIVTCPNPLCKATVPLLSKSWLSRRSCRFVAVAVEPDRKTKKIRFRLLHSKAKTPEEAIKKWKFNPSQLSKGGSTTCFHCAAAIEASYVREEGKAGKLGLQLISVVCTRPKQRGKFYIDAETALPLLPSEIELIKRIKNLEQETGLTAPNEKLPPSGSLGISVQNYGFFYWRDLFTKRQLLVILTFCKWVRAARSKVAKKCKESHQDFPDEEVQAFTKAVLTYLAFGVTKLANRGSTLVLYNAFGEKLESPISNGRMSINWDVAEANPLGQASGNYLNNLKYTIRALRQISFTTEGNSFITQGPAQSLDLEDASIDAVITDPPYYDNIPYAHLSDYFYIWLKKMLEPLYQDELYRDLTPKRRELIADRSLHNGNNQKARLHFEEGMQSALQELHRVLVPNGPLVIIYAHKTTAGWSSLIDALREAQFVVTEAWPLSTERPSRLRAQKAAALASSIFIVARKREGSRQGDYLKDVKPFLQEVIEERIKSLFSMGLQGADLIIACLGAGLRAFTQYSQVELPNGSEMSTELFLQEVQKEVAGHILKQVMGLENNSVVSIDSASQFYVFIRFQFGETALPYDEANILAKGLGLELDGYNPLTAGKSALLQKKGSNLSLPNYSQRGEHCLKLLEQGNYNLIDLLHFILWKTQQEPKQLIQLLNEYKDKQESLRLLMQALSGQKLVDENKKGGYYDKRTEEQKQLDILLAAWPREAG